MPDTTPQGRRGLYAAVVPASSASGLLLGSLLAAALTGVLSDAQMHSWGWRLPFLLAAPMGLIGRYIRRRLEDTPAFRTLELDHAVSNTPLRTIFTQHWQPLLLAVGATVTNAVGFYVLLNFMPIYLSEELGLGDTESFLASTIALLTYIGLIFVTGLASDRFGRRTMLLSSSALFIVLSVPAFMLLDTTSFALIVVVEVILGAVLSLNDGTLPSFLAELFPTRVRYSGFAVSFNAANALFGATAPLIAVAFISSTGDQIVPAYLLLGAAAVSAVAVLLSPETSRQPLREM
ncbi:MFS transporter [Mycobacterium sp.]|uniref:MFS transporter n=1 Tax=Mycobacterium sp. TaxID=1785 RepID=UPI003BACB4E2